MKFTIFQKSRQGPRPHNQDSIAYSYSKDALLVVVADGMGGHLHGEIAARFATQMLTEAFQREANPFLNDPFAFLVEHINAVQTAILDYAANKELLETPRTTLVVAIMQHDELYCVHVGDSRLYHLRDGKVIFCTEDHSKVQLLFRKGLISKDDLPRHPERNKVYNCLGASTPPQPELAIKRALRPGDIVMLCTDGLWSQLEEEELAEMLSRGAVTDTLPGLMDLAELRAGKYGDNSSAIALNWGDSDSMQNLPEISTATMPMDIKTTIMVLPPERGEDEASQIVVSDTSEDDLSDEYIESSIAEIQAAIKKTLSK
ncbi:PPM family protein phosphatase [Novimethylophilus kurashikiensis]|uniref:PPM family protein phosphatase n=1 Tax=Novimethylophilus kurashikiensis TaxID=1825523 RepID=A0A2R5F6V0_9PROT|nr:protein phosphatase 2C domain-containing protein [Novimethylophilus kurashikiensis]GBG13966.1 PPM family protein phosphatase [Novimethylophilus kurashikiensis]